MNNTTNYRIFVEKLPRFRVEAESLLRDLNANLNLSLDGLRLVMDPAVSVKGARI